MTTHFLKTWPPFFARVRNGTKRYELRKDAIDELVRVGRERDEARRAAEALDVRNKGLLLELAQSATSQVEGLVSAVTNSEDSSPSPAPIPLGAVVESVEYAYRFARYTHDWECMQGDPPVGHPVDVEVSALCTALYRALHPVADAATVKRVALRVKQYNGPTAVSAEGFARIILEELGYTIQEREA